MMDRTAYLMKAFIIFFCGMTRRKLKSNRVPAQNSRNYQTHCALRRAYTDTVIYLRRGGTPSICLLRSNSSGRSAMSDHWEPPEACINSLTSFHEASVHSP